MPRLTVMWLCALLASACGLGFSAMAHEQGGAPAAPGQPQPGSAATPRKMPDVTVVDQDGRTLSFYQDLVRGHTVAIDFIFTGCSTFCRPVTANLRAAQEELGARVGKDISLISISVDPANDTPAKLKSFAAQFGVAPGWSFLTGDKADIDRLLGAFGVGTHGPEDHSSLTLVGNDVTGDWRWTDSLAPADKIAASLLETADKKAATDDDRARVAAATERYMPNAELVDQDGKTVRLYDDLMRNKVVLLDFIFTQCTDACSPMTQNLASVQELLGDRVGRTISMVSISVDPEHDTPQALKAFADKFGAKPGWAFLTGPADQVNGIARKLGGVAADWHDHSTQIVIGNVPAGQWIKLNGLAAPEIIARTVLQIAGSGS